MRYRPWLAAAVLAVAGGVAFGVVSPAGMRAAVSYLAAFVGALAILAGGVAAVHWAGHIQPFFSMIVALMTYTLTVLIFAVVLAVSSPQVLDAWGFATGLLAAVLLWTIDRWRAARPGAGERAPDC